MVPFLDLAAATEEIREALDEAIARVLSSGWFVLGQEVEAFEREFATFVGSGHCVGVGNGLDAIELSLRAVGVEPGDEVIVPSNTYIATWLAVTRIGAVVVPVEPDLASYNLDPRLVEDAITPRTRAIVAVHLYGQTVEMEPLAEIAVRRNLSLVEDAAQAHGAMYEGRAAGTLGHVAAWSFYPSKNLGAIGDAGAVTTDDPGIAERVRVLRNYGSRIKYLNETLGVNSRLDELQAAVLRVKLSRLPAWNQRRHEVAARYCASLSDLPLDLPWSRPGSIHAWHLYVVRTSERDQLQRHLSAAGVQTLVHYPVPPHHQAAYADLGLVDGSLPISEKIHRECLSLPIGPHLSEEQVGIVIDAVRSYATR